MKKQFDNIVEIYKLVDEIDIEGIFNGTVKSLPITEHFDMVSSLITGKILRYIDVTLDFNKPELYSNNILNFTMRMNDNDAITIVKHLFMKNNKERVFMNYVCGSRGKNVWMDWANIYKNIVLE